MRFSNRVVTTCKCQFILISRILELVFSFRHGTHIPLSFQPMPPSTMAGHGIPPSQGRRWRLTISKWLSERPPCGSSREEVACEAPATGPGGQIASAWIASLQWCCTGIIELEENVHCHFLHWAGQISPAFPIRRFGKRCTTCSCKGIKHFDAKLLKSPASNWANFTFALLRWSQKKTMTPRRHLKNKWLWHLQRLHLRFSKFAPQKSGTTLS